MAESQSVAHSGRDGDDVFQRAAKFHSDHVVVGVDPEAGIAEFTLHGFRQPSVLRGDGDGGGIAARHFLGERRPAQRADARRKPCADLMTCAITSVIRRRVFSSRPLVALTNSICGVRYRQHLLEQLRQCCEGMTLTTISAPSQRFLIVPVAETDIRDGVLREETVRSHDG